MHSHRLATCFALCLGLNIGIHAHALAGEHSFHFLSAKNMQPSALLPEPSDNNSAATKAELTDLHQLITATPPARLAQARWDDKHEDPSLFDAVLGLKLEQFPKTWALLKATQNEADATADVTKVYFQRKRPWAIDPSMPRCDGGSTASPNRSYPSGHSTLGYTTGFILSRLLPGRSQLILNRAADYAESRRICGVHYPSDTEASHTIGTYIASQLMADNAFMRMFDAAQEELRNAHVDGI